MTEQDDLLNQYNKAAGKPVAEKAQVDEKVNDFANPVTGNPNASAPPGSEMPIVEIPKPRATRSQAIVQRPDNYNIKPLIPDDLDGAWRLAAIFASSKMLPKAYYAQGEGAAAASAFTAMQLGAEVGMSPMQSIQSIAVINGVCTIWGDTQKALVEKSGLAEFISELYEPDDEDIFTFDKDGNEIANRKFTAVCQTRRKGAKITITERFSVADAIRAGLWGKSGPWKSHPRRMLRYKARAFALRDTYPDVLKGLQHAREEMYGEIVENNFDNLAPDDAVSELEARQGEGQKAS